MQPLFMRLTSITLMRISADNATSSKGRIVDRIAETPMFKRTLTPERQGRSQPDF